MPNPYRYKVTGRFNDGKAEVPYVIVAPEELSSTVKEELENDEGRPFGPGYTLTIEVIE